MSRFLQFDNVALSYPGMVEPLLGGVTAHFPEDAWTGIVGANGAGKTTLLNSLGDGPHWRKVIENWINSAFY